MKYIPYSHQTITKDDTREVINILKSDCISRGPKIQDFEYALCSYTGAKYAVAVSSGTAALHLACLAAGIINGDCVITSPMTFVASVNCVLYCGGRSVFSDVEKETINISPDEIKKKISKKVKAIIPVHFAGYPAKLKEIHIIAKKNNLIVIEDACHALGSKYILESKENQKAWKRIGDCRYSDMAVFSFHPAKAITTGEGGVITTNQKNLYEKLKMLRNHGITKEKSRFEIRKSTTGDWYYEMQNLGYNYWLTDFQAALGLSQLKKLDNFISKRREIIDIYNKELSEINEIILPVEKPNVKSAWHLYCIRFKDHNLRNRVFKRLRNSGIGVQVHYIPVHLHPYYRREFGYRQGMYPIAEDYYRHTLTLPLYPQMKLTEIRYVIKALKKALK